MDSLTLKLVLTPALIAAASLVGRRWGPGISGWLVGLPLTSAPIVFFLALGHGPRFASIAATGTMAGTISQAAFCLTYARLASGGVALSVGAAALVFAACTLVLDHVRASLSVLFVLAVGSLVIALSWMPRSLPAESPGRAVPRWDLGARMVLATMFVVLLTGLAPTLGPRLAGLLAPFPIYATVLTIFAHLQAGPVAAASVLRGLLLGLFGFASFFLVLAVLLERGGIVLAFTLATLVAFGLQAVSLLILRRGDRERPIRQT